MRLDHLLSMETMGCFHEYPVVGIDESVRNLYGDFCCSIFGDQRSSEKRPFITRGCSSAGRAPALQAGGHGFDSHHLHHASERKHLFTFHSSLFTEKRKRESEAVKGTVDESEPHEKRSVAQVVRARA